MGSSSTRKEKLLVKFSYAPTPEVRYLEGRHALWSGTIPLLGLGLALCSLIVVSLHEGVIPFLVLLSAGLGTMAYATARSRYWYRKYADRRVETESEQLTQAVREFRRRTGQDTATPSTEDELERLRELQPGAARDSRARRHLAVIEELRASDPEGAWRKVCDEEELQWRRFDRYGTTHPELWGTITAPALCRSCLELLRRKPDTFFALSRKSASTVRLSDGLSPNNEQEHA